MGLDWKTEAAETLTDALQTLRGAMHEDDPCPLSPKEIIDIAKCAAEIVFEAEYGGGADEE